MVSSRRSRLSQKVGLPHELPATALHHPCNPDSLGFKTTDELPDLKSIIGQPRALRAFDLGAGVTGPGYNIFILGLPGSGRTTLSQEYLQQKAAGEPIPNDWCYFNNFENLRQPRALSLPPGKAVDLRKDMREFISHILRELPRAFESDEYTHERERMINEMKKSIENEFVRLQEYVSRYNFSIMRASFGFVLTPTVQGKPISPDEIAKLSEEQRAKLEQLQSKLSEEVERVLKLVEELKRTTAEHLVELNTNTALFLIQPLLKPLQEKYSSYEQIQAFFTSVQTDIVDHSNIFHPNNGESGNDNEIDAQAWAKRYEVNVLVDNSKLSGAPVVIESQPTYHNLLGSIEHEVVMGATRTDFTMLRPGALHRANGGYLVIPARDLLINPYAWEGLKRVLRDGSLRIIELGNQIGWISTSTLEPEPIPLQTKIVLVGTPLLYSLLYQYDEDFAKLFKVRAEFATQMDRNAQSEQEYGMFVKSVVEDNHLGPFDNRAVARIIEYSSRLAEDQEKLSTRFGKITDLIRESAYWARKNGQEVAGSEAVQQALDESVYRHNLIEERIQEFITQGTLRVAVTGQAVGQINGLSVYLLGDYSFGRPSRITAAVHPGQAGIVDIERQAKLGGPIHTKGVLILSGFLGGRFGLDRPLNLTASLTFEQSYDEVEGDSASAAELFALLSAIAGVPLRQDIAVTGSIDQLGIIQAIGGINEKIEGFFSVCKALGLNGSQGVIFPASNQRNLELTQEVVAAVAQGKFHLWPVQTVDECLALLTGKETGSRLANGTYPKDSFNASVADRLEQFSRVVAKSKSPRVKNSEYE